MPDFSTALLVAATFVVAGAVKGVIGLGLPTVTLALLTALFDLPSAMALLLVPSFITNAWQAASGGHGRAVIARLWPFFLMATLTVSLGAAALTHVQLWLLTALLGLLLVTYSALSLSGFRLVLPASSEPWAGPLIGSVNGVLTGMTGSFVVPGVMFLQAIGLPRDALIQAMGVLFTLSTLALAAALRQAHLLTADQTLWSLGAALPAGIGMVLGQRIRRNLPEVVFRKVFFLALFVLGAYIVLRALVASHSP
jgi:uncharacterized membrane protein YfcA